MQYLEYGENNLKKSKDFLGGILRILEKLLNLIKLLISKEFSRPGRLNLSCGLILVFFTIVMSIIRIEDFPVTFASFFILFYFAFCAGILITVDYWSKKPRKRK